MTNISDKERAWIDEICTDATGRPDRLTPWEHQFLAGFRNGLASGMDVWMSEKQREVMVKIERKLYST